MITCGKQELVPKSRAESAGMAALSAGGAHHRCSPRQVGHTTGAPLSPSPFDSQTPLDSSQPPTAWGHDCPPESQECGLRAGGGGCPGQTQVSCQHPSRVRPCHTVLSWPLCSLTGTSLAERHEPGSQQKVAPCGLMVLCWQRRVTPPGGGGEAQKQRTTGPTL